MTQKLQILSFIDDPAAGQVFTRSLQSPKTEVSIVASAGAASRMLAARRYDVVIGDVETSPQGGIEFLMEARRVVPTARRVLLTSHRDFDVARLAINQAGVHHLLIKPWIPTDLLNTISSLASRTQGNSSMPPLSEGPRSGDCKDFVLIRRTGLLLQSLVTALEMRDLETQWHSRRVAGYARHLGERLGLLPPDLLVVEHGALLHDVGKIGVSDRILRKPGKLSAEEWDDLRRHPLLGYQLLRPLEFLGDARTVVLQHHERWDGAGYPMGLRGEEICLGARIFAVVDAYDAITNDRPYRIAQDYQAARRELERHAGIQFDPRVVEAWCQVPFERWQQLRAEAETRSADFTDLSALA